jgi:hypothetical protein
MAHFDENLDHELAHGRLVLYDQNGQAGLCIVDCGDRVGLVNVFSSPNGLIGESLNEETSAITRH